MHIFDNSVINSLLDYNSTSHLIYSVYKEYYVLLERSVTVYINSVDNICEEILYAKAIAITAVNLDTVHHNLMSKSTVKRKIYEYMCEIWQNRWLSTQKGPQTKLYFPHINDRLKIKNIFNHDFYICQALTNHGNNNSYLKRFNLKEFQSCEKCGHDSDDSHHRIYDCIGNDSVRNDLKVAVINADLNWPPPPSAFITHKLYSHFIVFCKSIFS